MLMEKYLPRLPVFHERHLSEIFIGVHIMHMMLLKLVNICRNLLCIGAYYLNYSFTTSYIMSVIKQMENTKSNLQALMPLIAGKVVSDSILKKKISSSGLLCTI